MLLMIDNYDSFTYNLVQYFGELGAQVIVHRNDQINVADMIALKPSMLVISPGPCAPAQAGVSIEAINYFMGKVPILGVCLGHQSIGAALGGNIICAQQQMHGKTDTVLTDQKGVFAHLPRQFTVTRYHSLVIDRATLPKELEVSATSSDGEIMGVRHKHMPSYAPLEGVQFHPESILTEHGHAMLRNFLQIAA